MLDVLRQNQEQKQALQQEMRQENFAREQRNMDSADAEDYQRIINEKSDLIRWQQELAEDMEKLKHNLRSEELVNGEWLPKRYKVYNPETKQHDIYFVPARANEQFIDFIESQISPFLNKNFINSNLEEDRILNILRRTADNIVDFMSDNYDNIGVDFKDFTTVKDLILNTIIAASYRSWKGWTKNTDSTLMKRVEAFSSQVGSQQTKNKGLLGWFNG